MSVKLDELLLYYIEYLERFGVTASSIEDNSLIKDKRRLLQKYMSSIFSDEDFVMI